MKITNFTKKGKDEMPKVQKSKYLDMWDKVKELTPEQHVEWLNVVTPCTGLHIDFRGVRVCDQDVAEALQFMIDEHNKKGKM
jgi:hypothetical protein